MTRAAWRAFAAIILALFLARGIALACIIPPLEMWDEYQHVAYLQYLIENHRLPVYQIANVPAAVQRQAVRFPVSSAAGQQLRTRGAVGYAQFWSRFPARPTLTNPAGELPLYEALHPPLYYWLAAPLFRAAGGTDHLERSVAALRLVNVGLVAAGLALLLAWLGRACRDRREAMLIALWPALQPMLLLNAVRVSNDALAVLLGIATTVALLRLVSQRAGSMQRLLWCSAGVGLLLGLGVLAKATDFALLPFAAICLVVLAARRRIPVRALLAATAMMAAVVVAVTAGYYAFNFRHYRMLLPMQQAFVNRAHHLGWPDYLLWVRHHPLRLWPALWYRWIVTDGLWFGSWSFLHPWSLLPSLYAVGLAAAAPGWLLAWLFRRERLGGPDAESVFVDPMTVPLSLLLTAIVFAGLSVHALEALVAWGSDGTWPWYAAVATPWMLIAVAAGAIGWRRSRLGYGIGLVVPIACVLAEWISTGFKMIRAYAQLPPGLAALHRLALLQPPWLGTATLLTCAALAAVLTLAAIGWCTIMMVQAYRQRQPSPLPEGSALS